MYCGSSRVLSKNLTLYWAASYSNSSSINHSYIENNSEMSGFWRVAKTR
jgi:hypothetical protein